MARGEHRNKALKELEREVIDFYGIRDLDVRGRGWSVGAVT